MTTHLIIPDAHAQPGVSNERFTWLGRFILDRRPDTIVDLGDLADMESLSSYDRGKRSFEGRRYKADCRAAKDARRKLLKPIQDYNEVQRRNKKRVYTPRLVSLLGNHEHRIERATQDMPELDGTISYKDLYPREQKWEVHGFLSPVAIDGITYNHYMTSGVMGRPISGEYPAASILKKKFVSCVVGHIHTRDYAERTRADGVKIQALVAGCFFDQYLDYAGDANQMWWRGVTVLHDVHNGTFEPEFVSMEMLKKVYA